MVAVGEEDGAKRREGEEFFPRGVGKRDGIGDDPAAGELERRAADLALHARFINRPVVEAVAQRLEFVGVGAHRKDLATKEHRERKKV